MKLLERVLTRSCASRWSTWPGALVMSRAASWTDGDAVFLRPVDEVPHDEEVVDEAGDVDDRELVAHAHDEELFGREAGIVGWLRLLAGGKIGELGKSFGDDWVFGDGVTTNTTIRIVDHVYTNDCGPYNARVTVSDGQASTNSDLTVTRAL